MTGYRSPMLLSSLEISSDAFHAGTGWEAKPEGLCRDEVCVPAPDAKAPSGLLDVAAVAKRLRMPLVHDAPSSQWALGPSTIGGKALESATVPPLSLTTFDGTPFDFTSLHGRKVILAAWASW
jgi:hypothetical protein